MNGYASENGMFSFYRATDHFEKMVKCCLENLYGRTIESIHDLHRLYKPTKSKQVRNLCVGKTNRIKSNNSMESISVFFYYSNIYALFVPFLNPVAHHVGGSKLAIIITDEILRCLSKRCGLP